MDSRPADLSAEVREFYKKLRSRPGMFLGSDSLKALWHFIDGMSSHEALFGGETKRVFIPDGFNEFVEKHYGEHFTFNSFHFVLHFEGDSGSSFSKWFSLLDEYLVSLGYEPIPVYENISTAVRYDGICAIHHPVLNELAESYMRVFNSPPWNDSWTINTAYQRMHDLFRSQGFHGYAYWEDGKLLGAVMGETEHYFDGKVFRIIELWTDPSCRGRGIGRGLIEAVRNNDCGNVYLITKNTPETVGFYRKCGFDIDGGMCVMHSV